MWTHALMLPLGALWCIKVPDKVYRALVLCGEHHPLHCDDSRVTKQKGQADGAAVSRRASSMATWIQASRKARRSCSLQVIVST